MPKAKRRKEKEKSSEGNSQFIKRFCWRRRGKEKGAIDGGVELSLHILPRASHDVSVLAAGTS